MTAVTRIDHTITPFMLDSSQSDEDETILCTVMQAFYCYGWHCSNKRTEYCNNDFLFQDIPQQEWELKEIDG
jgi:hypothetical protein